MSQSIQTTSNNHSVEQDNNASLPLNLTREQLRRKARELNSLKLKHIIIISELKSDVERLQLVISQMKTDLDESGKKCHIQSLVNNSRIRAITDLHASEMLNKEVELREFAQKNIADKKYQYCESCCSLFKLIRDILYYLSTLTSQFTYSSL